MERAARGWGAKWRTCFDSLTSHEVIDEVYKKAKADTYQRDCDFEFNLESACDAAHERLTPSYFEE